MASLPDNVFRLLGSAERGARKAGRCRGAEWAQWAKAHPSRVPDAPKAGAGRQGWPIQKKPGSRVSRSLSSGRAERGPVGSPGTREALRVCLALRVDDLLELAEHMHARQYLGKARVRLALLLDGGDEL